MRRFWKSTEFYSTLVLVAALAYFARPACDLIVGACIVLNSYIIGRTLWKKNRGQLHSAAISSEFYALLAGQGLAIYGMLRCDLRPLCGFRLLIINQVIYNLCRGISKSIGVKNHFI